jgi:hypothetical protein
VLALTQGMLGALRVGDVTGQDRERGHHALRLDGADDVGKPSSQHFDINVIGRRGARREGLLESLAHGVVIRRGNEIERGGLADELIARKTRRRVIDVEIFVVGIDDDDEVEGIFRDRPPPLFGGAKRRLELLPLRDVFEGREDALYLAVEVAHGDGAHHHRKALAVFAAENQLDRGRLALERSRERALDRGALFGRPKRKGRRPALELFGFEPGQFAELRIDVEENALRIDDGEPVRHRGDDSLPKSRTGESLPSGLDIGGRRRRWGAFAPNSGFHPSFHGITRLPAAWKWRNGRFCRTKPGELRERERTAGRGIPPERAYREAC